LIEIETAAAVRAALFEFLHQHRLGVLPQLASLAERSGPSACDRCQVLLPWLSAAPNTQGPSEDDLCAIPIVLDIHPGSSHADH
jgi:hypothetical protein